MSQIKNQVSDLAVTAIGAKTDVLALRGTDEQAREGGDIDILVPQGDAKTAALALARASQAAGLAVIDFRDIGYIVQLCICDPDVDNAAEAAIKVDLWNGMAWQSLGRDSLTHHIMAIAKQGEGDAKAVAVTTFLQKLMYAGSLRERDKKRIFDCVSVEFLGSFCQAVGLRISPECIRSGRIGLFEKWRFRAASCSLHGWQTSIWLLQVLFLAIVRRTFGASQGPGEVIGVAGRNEREKSALVERFSAVVEAAEFRTPIRMGSALAVCLQSTDSGEINTADQANDEGRSQLRTGSWLVGRAKLVYYIVAFYFSAIWCRIHASRGESVLVDNTPTDFAVDLTRFDIPHRDLPGPLIRQLTPKGKHFWLTDSEDDQGNNGCETDVDDQNKIDVTTATLHRRYAEVSRATGSVMLDGNQSSQTIFRSFANRLSETYIAHLET